jgi:hypothetical protein
LSQALGERQAPALKMLLRELYEGLGNKAVAAE